MLIIIITNASADEELSLRTGICRFQYDADADSSLANGVSAAFFETARLVTEHQLNSEEIKSFQSKQKKVEIKKKIIELEDLYSSRDKIIFSESGSEYLGKLKEKDEEIEKKKAEILESENDILKISAGIEEASFTLLPVVFNKPEDSRFFLREAGGISETAEKNKLDLLIYGFIERLQDYSYIEVRLWNNLLNRDTVLWRTAVGSENVNELIKEGRNIIKTKLLGHEWSELTVRGPDNSMIYIDGLFSGIGGINALIREPGSVSVEVKKNGYESLTKTAILESNTETVLDFQLEQNDYRSVVIQTFPAAAAVYLDSEWMGLSPLRLEPENETSAIRIKKSGFIDESFFIDEMTEQIININLKSDSSGRDQWVPDARKRFYAGFGSFIMSIPVTALFYSLVEQTGDAYQRESGIYEEGDELRPGADIDELIRLQNLNRAQYSLYAAALGLNIFMFLDTIIQAVEYVNSVEYFSF